MGARVARQRAASRSAKKRASASPAPVEGSTLAPVGEKRVSALTKEQPSLLTNLKVVPTRKSRGACKNPAETAPAPTGTGTTQTADNSDRNLLAEDKQDFPETVPDDNVEVKSMVPERRAREGFTALLAQIVEEPEFSDADRSIGNYQFQDEEWEKWKAGPGEPKDEYEVGSDSDGTQSVATTSTRFPEQPLGRHASIKKLSKPQTGKTKATGLTGGSKRKYLNLDLDSDSDTEPDPESEVGGEHVMHVMSCALHALILQWAEFTYLVDISSKAKDIHKVITQSSTAKWSDFEENIAKILNIFTPNLRAQYVLSTEPTNTIPIALTSVNDLAELHTRLAPLIVPPRNANGSKSKRKMKEVTVKVTDKNEDTPSSKTSSVSNGKKVRHDRHIL
jgi:hypothetical protein